MKLKSLFNVALPVLLAFSAITQVHAGQPSEKLLTPKLIPLPELTSSRAIEGVPFFKPLLPLKYSE